MATVNKMTKEDMDAMRTSLREYYERTLAPQIWRHIGISHIAFLRFMYPDLVQNEPIFRTCLKVKKFLNSLPKEQAIIKN